MNATEKKSRQQGLRRVEMMIESLLAGATSAEAGYRVGRFWAFIRINVMEGQDDAADVQIADLQLWLRRMDGGDAAEAIVQLLDRPRWWLVN